LSLFVFFFVSRIGDGFVVKTPVAFYRQPPRNGTFGSQTRFPISDLIISNRAIRSVFPPVRSHFISNSEDVPAAQTCWPGQERPRRIRLSEEPEQTNQVILPPSKPVGRLDPNHSG
jgi:hypothetical protein